MTASSSSSLPLDLTMASKRSLTLDLNPSGPGGSQPKRSRLAVPTSTFLVTPTVTVPGATPGGGAPPILTTPDVQMLKLSSPELAKFLTSTGSLATPTPGGYIYPKTVTEEQELYAKGFEDALKNMHNTTTTKAVPVTTTSLVLTTPTTTAALLNSPTIITTLQPATLPTLTLGNTVISNNTAISTIERATSAHRNTLTMAASVVSVAQPATSTPATAVLAVKSSASSSSSSSSASPPNPRPASGASGSLDSTSEYLLPDTVVGASAGTTFVSVKEEQDSGHDDDDEDLDDEDDRSSSNSTPPLPKATKARGRGGGRARVDPVDMKDQERLKLERKRMRNRLAASKCRKRKLERIALLDDKVKVLKGENAELAGVVKRLKEAVCSLKQEVMSHVNSGCNIMLADMTAFSS